MIDVKNPVRKAYFQLLNNNLFYGGEGVPVSDGETLGKKLYVILAAQSGVDNSTFQSFDSNEDIVIDIIYKASSKASRQPVDAVASQILSLVLPSPAYNGLPGQAGIQINCVKLSDDRDLDLSENQSNAMRRRILTFSQKVRQTGSISVVPTPGSPFKNNITSSDFINATDYRNNALSGINYVLYLNGEVFLVEDRDYQKLSGGGFRILLPGFDALANLYSIFVIRQ
jgi:hypothetical protein